MMMMIIIMIPLFITFGDKNYGNITVKYQNTAKYIYIYIYISYVQYCEKVMRAKCANFVLCPCELSTKFRSKIRASFRDVSRVISLKQREKIRLIFRAQRENSL